MKNGRDRNDLKNKERRHISEKSVSRKSGEMFANYHRPVVMAGRLPRNLKVFWAPLFSEIN